MSTTISIRTNLGLKNKAVKILEKHGLNLSTAFNMYLSDIVNNNTVPVSDIRFVKKEIMKEWEEEIKIAKKEGIKFSSAEEMLSYYK